MPTHGRSHKEVVVEGASECDLSVFLNMQCLHDLSKAVVGEVLQPEKSNFIHDEFVHQWVFSIKATLMGSDLVLFEGSRDEEDFQGFVEEARDWLHQWFKWICP